MERQTQNKIVPINELINKVNQLQKQGKTVVQSHGVFDLIHPGHIRHLKAAKKMGDVLVATIIRDKDVRRGPGRPVFPEFLRAENLASLEIVDNVSVVDDEIPFGCVKMIKPDIFAKGQAHKERDGKIHEKLFENKEELCLGESRVFETDGFSFSSSKIINNFLDIYPEDTKVFLNNFSKKYSFQDILARLNDLKNMKVLLIGDGIIDEYHYCDSMGKSAKAHLVVSKYLNHEMFSGGTFAIANHIAGICDNVTLVSLLGNVDSKEDFIRSHLKPNIEAKFFYRNDGPTIVKKRYVNQYLNQKLFEVNYLTEDCVNGKCEEAIVKYLKKVLPEYELVLAADFGHGFISGKIIKIIEKYAKTIAVNTQTNSANWGFNMITKYERSNFVCLDESELRLATQERFVDIESIAGNIKKQLGTDCLIATLGKKGSVGINGKGEINRTPIFSSRVIDTVGAGDAFFAYTAPCYARNMPLDMISFIGNAVGALAVQIIGNKKSVEKHELLEFIHAILK